MSRQLVALGGGGMKSIPLDQLGSWGELGIMPWATGRAWEKGALQLAQTVAYLYRGIEIRANAVATVPWAIYRANAEQPLWESDAPAPPPQLALFGDLPEWLYRIEGALCVTSQAYLYKERNRVRVVGVRWLDPTTMTPWWTANGLEYFQRAATYESIMALSPNDVVYIWQKGLSEIEPKQSPAHAALSAANALDALGAFVANYFARGAIKATLLTVDQMPMPEEAEKLKSWWQRVVAGVRNAFGTEVIEAGVKPVVVGEGIGELSNTELSNEQREDIATALGVPHSLIMSDAANMATANVDQENFYLTTIIPQCRLIQRQINAQLFEPLGYRFAFRPQDMALFQADESARADALQKLVQAGFKLSVAAQTLGMDLPEGVDYADLDQEPIPPPVPPAPVVAEQPMPMPPDDGEEQPMPMPPDDGEEQRIEEQRRFVRWAKKRKGAVDPCAFKSNLLGDDEKEALLVEMGIVPFTLMAGAITPDAIKALILQLDPDDPEAEQKVRMALERKHARSINDAFHAMYETLYPGRETFEDDARALARIEQNIRASTQLRDALQRALVDSADLGVSVAVNQLEGVGFSFDWLLANAAARDWATQHTGELVRGIDDASLRMLREATSRWIQNGEPLDALIDDLAPVFGEARAGRIAATEVTRAYQKGSEITWKESGVVGEMEWVTVNDEAVCPVCGPMDGKKVGLDEEFDGGNPPLHPNCRCFTRPVIARRR